MNKHSVYINTFIKYLVHIKVSTFYYYIFLESKDDKFWTKNTQEYVNTSFRM